MLLLLMISWFVQLFGFVSNGKTDIKWQHWMVFRRLMSSMSWEFAESSSNIDFSHKFWAAISIFEITYYMRAHVHKMKEANFVRHFSPFSFCRREMYGIVDKWRAIMSITAPNQPANPICVYVAFSRNEIQTKWNEAQDENHIYCSFVQRWAFYFIWLLCYAFRFRSASY